MHLTEVRKEDNLYFQGPFWIAGSEVKEIKRGHFSLISKRYLCDYQGNYVDDNTSKSSKTHKSVWKTYGYSVDYNYFPRGRVGVYNGTAFIHLHSLFNQPDIIDSIIDIYQLDGLDIEIEENNTFQGNHYDFQLT